MAKPLYNSRYFFAGIVRRVGILYGRPALAIGRVVDFALSYRQAVTTVNENRSSRPHTAYLLKGFSGFPSSERQKLHYKFIS